MGRTIYLDLDGVLADFDTAARKKLRTDNNYLWEFQHGTEAFWRKLNGDGDFFETVELMADAWDLLGTLGDTKGVAVLTAIPKTSGTKAARQKKRFVRDNFGSYKVITCFTKDKPLYCSKGDILIDDRTINRAAWEAKGGLLIHHTSAANTITTLRALGVI